MEEKDIYACKNHIEIALDDFVVLNEKAPEMIRISDGKCTYCEEKAEYKLF